MKRETMTCGRRRKAIAVGLAVLPLVASEGAGGGRSASAATVHWDIDGPTGGSGPDDTPSGTWNGSNAFWSPDSNGFAATSAWVGGDTANFSAGTDASGAFTVTVSGTQTAGGVTFQDGTVTLAGGTLNLNGAATLNVNILRSATINSVISGSAGLSKAGSGTLDLGGNNTFTGTVIIDGGGGLRIGSDARLGNTSNDVTISNGSDLITTASISFPSTRVFTMGAFGGNLAPDAGTTLTVNSPLNSNTNSLIMNGQGTLVLTTASTRSGATTINNGVLRITNATALGTAGSGSVTIDNGGTLEIDGVALDKPITLRDGAKLRGDNNAESLGIHTVASGAAVTLNPFSGFFTIGNAANDLTGGGGGSTITVTGGNFAQLFNDSNYTGNWIVSSGLIQIDADASLGNAANTVSLDNGRFSATETFSTARTFTLGAGGGFFQASSGKTLVVSGPIGGSGPLSKIVLGTLVLSGANTFTGPVAVTGGTLSIDADARLGNTANDVTLDAGTLATTQTMTTGAGRNFTIGGGGGTFSTAASTTLTIAGSIAGSGALNKTGAGTLVLVNTGNSYSGGTTINQGTLRLDGGQEFLPATTLANTPGTLLDVNGFQTIGGLSGGGPAGGNVTLGPGASLRVDQTGTTTFGGTVTGSGLLVKLGPGTLVFTGTQIAPRDGTYIQEGTVRLGGSNIIDGLVVVYDDAVFDLNGNTETIRFTIGGGGSVLLGTGGALTVDDDLHSDYGGVISGNGSLIKTGSGSLTLFGNNTYTGGTTVSAGTLRIGIGGASGSVVGNITNDALLIFERSDTSTFAGAIGGSGAVIKEGTGTLVLTGTSAYAGQTSIKDGTVRLASGAAITATSSITAGNSSGPDGVLDVAGGTVTTGTGGVDVRLDGDLRIGTGGRLNTNGIILIRSGALFTVSIGGRLDLTDEKLIANSAVVGGVGTAVGGAYTGLSALIQSGRAGGAWNGSGIITSETSATTGNFTSIGIATAQQAKSLATSTVTAVWAGQTVTGSDVLVMYTYGGDANLDGKINVDDYGRIDFNVNLGTSGWFNGDFNYDGKINVDDYGIIDFNVGIQGAPFFTSGGASASSAGASLSGGSAVPEPATLSVVALGATALLARRRRRDRRD